MSANASETILVHLHPDFQQPLEELFDSWNQIQSSWNFVGIRPRREYERALLTPGAISSDDASQLAARIRAAVGYTSEPSVIVFTEKRLFDDKYDQLFLGGQEADEDPPSIGIVSLEFLRRNDLQRLLGPVLFRAVISNILYSLGVDSGLDDHHDETRGCVMDFCNYMPDIVVGLREGPRFCAACASTLGRGTGRDLVRLADRARNQAGLISTDETVTESIVVRGKRYANTINKFDYDVALSFAGPDRDHAEQLAIALRDLGLEVFYDLFDQEKLWGRNLHPYLTELYRIRARYCVVFLSAHYKRSKWTRVELDAALAREFEEGSEYILPIRLDDAQIPGLLSTRAYLDWHEYSAAAVADMVKKRLVEAEDS
ncbi:MAG TPA: TIR domain-containing protein [Kofleriaceae bacterium]